jgi:hypothetical protein
MRINRMTVDKLGVKLYDRVYAVIAELISNSYDADAELVTVRAPMGQYLASKVGGKVQSKPTSIEVEDNGGGMSPDELQDFYLIVGSERRKDPRRGDKSKKYGRKVMGRKGVGKLAPFGVCRFVEILSAGGEKINEGETEGYRIAHVILDKDAILDDSVDDYEPKVGDQDGALSSKTFTKVILREFDYRYVGSIDELSRQLSQRFGLTSKNWQVVLEDTSKAYSHSEYKKVVGGFDIAVMPGTKIEFKGALPTESTSSSTGYSVVNTGTQNINFEAGFTVEGKFYPVVGWIAYAEKAYKDELMAGVRIYCRGKFAAQTTVFNRASGFTGEFGIRSYIIGELHIDWLDEEEDLIQTDRRDILWSHELCSEFQQWGQKVVECIGKLARNPMRKTSMDIFFKEGDVQNRINQEFPGKDQKDLRDGAVEVAKLLGKSMRGDEVYDPETIEDMLQLSLILAPLRTLDDKLREAADEDNTTLSVVNDILRTAKLAEIATFGRAVQKRIQIIHRLESLKDSENTPESELQDLIEEAPWLVNPQWVPIIANQWLNTFKKEFAKFYKEKTGDEIHLSDFTESKKRPDFVLFGQDGKLQIIEIKQPKHALQKDEMDRIITYYEQFEAFISDPKHKDFSSLASDFHITLVCDKENLKGAQLAAYNSYIRQGRLTAIDWSSFLLRTAKAHQEFLDEAARIKELR